MSEKIEELLEKITNYIRPPYRSNPVTDKILQKTGGRGLYVKHEIDLSKVNSDMDIPVHGDNLTVEDCPGAVTVKLNHIRNPEVDLQKIDEVEGPFKHLFINNSAGSGTLKFFTGDKGMFRAKKKINKFNDGEKLIFGTDDDWEITFDGTNFKIGRDTYPRIRLVAGYVVLETTPGTGKISMREGISAFFEFYENATDDTISGSTLNNDMYLKPNGTGVVKFGTYSAKGVEAFAGFATIKTGDGVSRKVMICA